MIENELNSAPIKDDILQMQEKILELHDEIDLINAESVMDLSITLNKDKEFVKEMIGMGALRDMFKEEFKEEIEEKDRKINDLSEQLQNKEKQLKTEREENIKLRKELEENAKIKKELEDLKRMVGNKIAML